MHVIKDHKNSLIPPWTPVLLHYSRDCTTLFSSRVNGTVIKPISSSSEEKISWYVSFVDAKLPQQSDQPPCVFKTIPPPPQCPTDMSKIWLSATFRDISPIWETGYLQICVCARMYAHIYAHKSVQTQIQAQMHTGLVQSCAVPWPTCSVFSSQWLFSGIL